MGRTCQRTRAGVSTPGTWSLDADALRVLADGGLAEAYRLGELSGIGGDEYAIELELGAETVTLAKLGSEGSTLLATLRRTWLPRRADALRLTGAGAPKHFAASVAVGDAAPRRAALLLFDDALLVAPDGADVEPVFLSLLAAVRFDAAALAVRLEGWGGTAVTVAKLAGQTEEFVAALQARRAQLGAEAAEVLARQLPTLPPETRATLAANWLPGRMLSRAELDRLAPGAWTAFAASWLGPAPRREYGEALLALASPEQAWVGYARPGAGKPAGGDGAQPAAAGAAPATATPLVHPPLSPATGETPAATGGGPAAGAAPTGTLLWLLVQTSGRWLLEAVSETDWATYRFAADGDFPALASHLGCAAQFSREALYMPLAELTGDRSEMAIAARELPFLCALRERFRGRVIHTSMETWRAGLTAP